MNIGYLIRRGAQWYSDKIFLIDGKRRLTFHDVNLSANRLVNALYSLGCGKGDRVAILLPNCIEYVLSEFGTMKAGMVVVPLNPRLSPGEYEYIIDDSKSTAIIFDAEYIRDVSRLLENRCSIQNYLCVGSSPERMLGFEETLMNHSAEEPEVTIEEEEDLGLLKYTSGTTGKAKGVMLTHKNLRAVATNLLADRLDLTEKDCLLATGPLTHATGFYVLPFWIKGARIVIHRRFDVQIMLETIQREKVTHLFLVPTMIRMLVDYSDIRNYDLDSLTQINYGASPISPELLKDAVKIFGHIFVQGYGVTEAPVTASLLRKEHHVVDGNEEEVQRLASIGRELTNIEIKILDENGRDCKPGALGEIVIKSDTVMKGYWKLPEETKHTLKDGWIYTGDIGRIDEKGFVYLIDRKNDLIITGGFNVYPKEVESAIELHPKVKETAVIGIPDEKWGEAIKAVVVLKEGLMATEQEIIDFCGLHLSGYKKPKSVEFSPSLPRSSFGKVQRKVLKEKYWKDLQRKIH